MMARKLISHNLDKESKALYLGKHVEILDHKPSSLEFLRYVCLNKPFIIRCGKYRQPACSLWTLDYLKNRMVGDKVTLSVTPDGWADAVRHDEVLNKNVFILPFEYDENMENAIDMLVEQSRNAEGNKVYYLQTQNNCLRTEYHKLEHIWPEIPWASEAFGYSPDAVNMWIGTRHSVTSLHRDNYENIYCVIRGTKKFFLYPPTNCLSFPQKSYPTYRYSKDLNEKIPVGYETEWYPDRPIDEFVDPLVAEVKAGDFLYLPFLWYHHVEQMEEENDVVIAVNYWYDSLAFDHKYCFTNALCTLMGDD